MRMHAASAQRGTEGSATRSRPSRQQLVPSNVHANSSDRSRRRERRGIGRIMQIRQMQSEFGRGR